MKEENTKLFLINTREILLQGECVLNITGFRVKYASSIFFAAYGELGKDFIHVHHIVPLAEIGETYEVDPITDLIPVCPNCHAMIHRKSNFLSIDDLKSVLFNKTS